MSEKNIQYTTRRTNLLKKFFSAYGETRSYKNIFYLLLSFPLGIVYFTLLMTGLSLGLGLLVTFAGIFILLGTILLSNSFSWFERSLTKWLLNVDIPHQVAPEKPEGFWNMLKATFTALSTWKGLVHHFARFPLGFLAFVLVVTFLSTSLALIAAPVAYAILPQSGFVINFSVWMIDTPLEYALSTLSGLILLTVSLHLFNGLAWAYGQFTSIMLSSTPTEAKTSVKSETQPTVESVVLENTGSKGF